MFNIWEQIETDVDPVAVTEGSRQNPMEHQPTNTEEDQLIDIEAADEIIQSDEFQDLVQQQLEEIGKYQ